MATTWRATRVAGHFDMRTLAIVFITVSGVLGCTDPKPGMSLSQVKFAEPPVVIQRGENFYLHCRRDMADKSMPLYIGVHRRKDADAAYFFFTFAVSSPEWGAVYEWPLVYEYAPLARAGRVYWLDPDGTKHPIPVRLETP